MNRTLSLFAMMAVSICLGLSGVGRTSQLMPLPAREEMRLQLGIADRAWIQEERSLTLVRGRNDIRVDWEGVEIDPDSVSLEILERKKEVRVIDSTGSSRNPTAATWQIYSELAGNVDARYSYVVGGLSSRMQYRIIVDEDETHADLEAHLLVTNGTGMDIPLCRCTAANDITFSLELAEGESRSIPLFDRTGLALTRQFVLDSRQSGSDVVLSYHVFPSAKDVAAGWFLPGVARVYRRTTQGELVFLGEDRIDELASDSGLELAVGRAGDVVVKRTQLHYEQSVEAENDRGVTQLLSTREAYQVDVSNYTEDSIDLTVLQDIPGPWAMLESSPAMWETRSAHLIAYKIKVPAGKTEIVSYRIQRGPLLPRERVQPLMP